MKLRPNAVRQKLAAGQRVAGAAVFSWSPNVIDAAVDAGLDYIRIDTEHAWRRDDTLEQLIRGAVLAGIVPIVRVDRDNPFLVRKALEIGAGGVIVPDVRSASEAQSVARAARFPPMGDRGLSRNCWSAGWGAIPADDWIEWSNREPMVGVMIENNEALSSIESIASVDGIDFALFGPADYSMSLGLAAPDAGDKRIQDAIMQTAAAFRSRQKHFSLVVGNDPANIEKYIRLGVDMLELGNDLDVVRSGWARAKAATESANLSAGA